MFFTNSLVKLMLVIYYYNIITRLH